MKQQSTQTQYPTPTDPSAIGAQFGLVPVPNHQHTGAAMDGGKISLNNLSDNSVITSIIAGTGISVSGATGDVTINANVSASSTTTFTNKRITRRVVIVTQSATPTINTDNTDVAYITGLAQAVTSFTTNLSGTPVNGDTLIIDITDNGTGYSLTFGTSFESSTVLLPTTTVASTKLTIGFRWNVVTSKWTCVAVA